MDRLVVVDLLVYIAAKIKSIYWKLAVKTARGKVTTRRKIVLVAFKLAKVLRSGMWQ